MGLISGLLEWLGAPGSVILVFSTLLALYHGRSILKTLSGASIYARFAGLTIFLGALAVSGLVPGVHLELDVGTFGDALGGVLSWLPLEKVLP